MKKGTKKIRHVTLPDGNSYFVYDLDEDFYGKIKRIYAKTEGELQEKINKAKEDREKILLSKMPVTEDLKSWVQFYLKTQVGKLAASTVKRLAVLGENTIYQSNLNVSVKELSEEKVRSYLLTLAQTYPMNSVLECEDLIRNALILAGKANLCNITLEKVDYSSVITGENRVIKGYIPSQKELGILLEFCLLDDCTKYSTKELVITFILMTGLKATEILAVRTSDININQKKIRIGKRDFVMSEDAANWLKEQEKKQRINLSDYDYDEQTGIYTKARDNELVFTNKGKAITQNNTSYTLRIICQRCGLPLGITLLMIHKAFIANEYERGVSAKKLAKNYGYTPEGIVKIAQEAQVSQLLHS